MRLGSDWPGKVETLLPWMAYKDIDAVMEAQKDRVEVVHTLKRVVCVKG